MSPRTASEPTIQQLLPGAVLALSIEEACGALGITWDLWNRHVAPEVRMVRLGRRRLVPVAELQRFLAEHADLAFDDD